jgi:hypothetical protein
MAYMRAISAVATLYPARWQADAGVTGAAIKVLQQLYLLPLSEVKPLKPDLAEFEFRSDVPLLGGLISRVRALWFGVAARWAVRYLAGQQEAINHQLRAILARQEETNELYVRTLVSLSEDVARLTARLEGLGEISAVEGAGSEAQ